MKKLLQLLIGLTAVIALTVSPVSAQEYGMKYTRGVKHITTKTTTHVATANCTLYTIIINVSGAGTSWTVTVQDVTNTYVLYTATVATGTTVIALPVGIAMAGGFDIVTGGSTAGTMDVWYAYR